MLNITIADWVLTTIAAEIVAFSPDRIWDERGELQLPKHPAIGPIKYIPKTKEVYITLFVEETVKVEMSLDDFNTLLLDRKIEPIDSWGKRVLARATLKLSLEANSHYAYVASRVMSAMCETFEGKTELSYAEAKQFIDENGAPGIYFDGGTGDFNLATLDDKSYAEVEDGEYAISISKIGLATLIQKVVTEAMEETPKTE